MKVGVLTFHWADNYGAVLQGYGLCRALTNLGHTVKVINYIPPSERWPWWRGWRLRSGRQMPLHAIRRIRFQHFRRTILPLSSPCHSMKQLRSLSEELDAVVVGSDQVWNGHIVPASDPYFLNFAASGCRRISFAASAGEASQPPATIEAAARLLPYFDAVSVRDEVSARLVYETSGREAVTVLDPSLLYGYDEVLGRAVRSPGYVAMFFICPQFHGVGSHLARTVGEDLQRSLLTISADGIPGRSNGVMLSAGPSEWLRVLHDASFICTDSFHGTLFAIKFRKPFLCWPALRPGRLEAILRVCGLESRLVHRSDAGAVREVAKAPIDYDGVARKLDPHLRRSLNFLESALADE